MSLSVNWVKFVCFQLSIKKIYCSFVCLFVFLIKSSTYLWQIHDIIQLLCFKWDANEFSFHVSSYFRRRNERDWWKIRYYFNKIIRKITLAFFQFDLEKNWIQLQGVKVENQMRVKKDVCIVTSTSHLWYGNINIVSSFSFGCDEWMRMCEFVWFFVVVVFYVLLLWQIRFVAHEIKAKMKRNKNINWYKQIKQTKFKLREGKKQHSNRLQKLFEENYKWKMFISLSYTEERNWHLVNSIPVPLSLSLTASVTWLKSSLLLFVIFLFLLKTIFFFNKCFRLDLVVQCY